MPKSLFPALLIIALPLACPAALAQNVGQPSTIRGDISQFHGTAESLPDAISKVERATGGKVIEIRFTNSDGMPGYHAVVAKGGDVSFMHLDAKAGKLVTVQEKTEPDWMLNWRGKAELRYAVAAKVPLTDAIKTAEQADNGAPAVAAGIARSASSPGSDVHAYNILVDRDGNVHRRAVDSATNEVIADPGALSDWP